MIVTVVATGPPVEFGRARSPGVIEGHERGARPRSACVIEWLFVHDRSTLDRNLMEVPV